MKPNIRTICAALLSVLLLPLASSLLSVPAAAESEEMYDGESVLAEAVVERPFMSELFFGSDGSTVRVTDGKVTLPLKAGGHGISYSTVTVPTVYETPNNAVRFVIANYSSATYIQVKYTYVTDYGPVTETQSMPIGAYSGRSTYLLRIPQADSLVNMTLILPDATGSSIMLHGMEAVRLWTDDMAGRESGQIQSCVYNSASKTVIVKGSVYHDVTIAAAGASLYLYRLAPSQSLEELLADPTAVPVAYSAMSIGFQLRAPATDVASRFARYVVLISMPDGKRVPLSAPCFATSEGKAATEIDRDNFKGIETTLISGAIDSNVGSAVVDVYLNRLENEKNSGYLYTVENKYFYFDRAYLAELDAQIRSLSGAACKVYLRFLVEEEGAPLNCAMYDEPLSAASSEGETTSPARYRAMHADTTEALRDLYAYTSFLTARYHGTDVGDIAGIIIGSRVDQSEKYHAAGDVTLPEYVEMYGQTLQVIAGAAQDINSELTFIVPVSDSWNASLIGGAHRRGDFTVELFVDSLAAYLSLYGGSNFTVMIESTHNPYGLNDQYFEPIQTDGEEISEAMLPKLTPATQDSPYLSSENIVLLDNYLAIHAAQYDSLADRYYFHWSPDEQTGGNALSASYVYHYYRLFHDNRAAAFFVSFREKETAGNLTEFSKIRYLVKYIDTDSGSYRTSFALDIFEVESWGDLIDGFRRDLVEHTRLSESNFAKYDADGIVGSYTLFDFGTANSPRGWYAGNYCLSVDVSSNNRYEKSLNARMKADLSSLAEYSDIAYRFPTPMTLEYTPYITVSLMVEGPTDQDFVYEVKLSCGSDDSYTEAKQVVRNGEQVTLTMDVSQFSAVSQMEYMRLSVKTVMGENETFTLRVNRISLDSQEYDSDALRSLIDATLNSAASTSRYAGDSAAADPRLLIMLGGALFAGTLIAVLMVTHYQHHMSDSDDDPTA